MPGRRTFRQPPSSADSATGPTRMVTRILLAVATLAAVLSPTAAWPLSVTTSAITFTGVGLDGTIQTVDGSTSAWQVDAGGEAGGWNMTVSSTDLTNAESKAIPVANVTVRLANANISVVSGDPNGPTSAQTTYTAMSGTALKIATAASGDGDGVYNLTPEFQVSVPAETFTGNYSATVTVAVNTGP